MTGIGGSEFILLCLIGLLILGPERLPRFARQVGGWVGKARQMTRAMQRQLENELDVEKNLGIDPRDLDPRNLMTPRDDDTYSPLHVEEDNDVPAPGPAPENPDEADEPDEPDDKTV